MKKPQKQELLTKLNPFELANIITTLKGFTTSFLLKPILLNNDKTRTEQCKTKARSFSTSQKITYNFTKYSSFFLALIQPLTRHCVTRQAD